MPTRPALVSLVYAAILVTACGAPSEVLPDGGVGGGAGGGSVGGGGGAGGGTGGTGGGAMACTCQLPNAVAECGDAGCALVKCNPGFRDLDRDVSNGCESTCQPLTVGASGSLDFDLKVLQLSGRVTQNNGQPLAPPRGTLRFELSGSKPVDLALPATGDATYAAKLFAGQYRVSYVRGGVAKLIRAQALTASGALDFDVTVGGTTTPTNVLISGAVTANGAPLAARGADQPRATVRFVSAQGTAISAQVPGTGASTYSASLPPGSYDVVVDGDPSCGAANAVVPCHPSVRKKALQLNVSGSLDLDLTLHKVGGAVTVNGQPMPAGSGERGQLKLTTADGEGPALLLGSSGAAQWSTLVYAGTYDVVVSRASCAASGGLPCQPYKAKSQVPLTAAGVLDVDLQVFDVSGQVLANGQPLAASPRGANRGTLSFKPGAALPLGVSGAASYQARLYPGTYEVVIANAADCGNGPLPCGTKTVRTFAVTASGVLDVDVPVLHLSGGLTVNGAAMPPSPSGSPRGTVTFDGPTAVPVQLGANGAAVFDATVYAGTYRIWLDNTADCPTGPAPCQKRVLDAARTLTADGALSYDLPVIDVTGAVTHNGQAVAGSTATRGALKFRDVGGTTVVAPLGTTGPAGFRARLYAANYEVLFENTTDCPAGDTSPLPCQGEAQVAPFVALTASGARDFDVKSVTLSGLIQVNAAQMGPSGAGQARGVVRFAASGAPPASRPLSASGAATYQVRLVPGRYDVGVENTADCGTGALPCQKQLLAGCEAP